MIEENIKNKGIDMKAIIEDLIGKYYGTRISIVKENVMIERIDIWVDGWTKGVVAAPSPRELIDCSPLDWAENKWLPDVICQATMQKGCYTKEFYEITNSHYENCTSYYIALKIADSFNGTDLAEKFKPMHDKLLKRT